MLILILVACLSLSWSVTCARINFYLQSVVLTGFVFFSQFFWALRFLFRLNDSILIKFLVFQGFFFRNPFIWKNTCSPCGCFVRQLVWWTRTRTTSVSSDSFYVKFSRTDKMYAFFTRIGAHIWNSIPYSIKILKRSSFRKKIKELLLNFLRSEDDYVEVSRLLKLFNTLG